jgi:hypothetical protein
VFILKEDKVICFDTLPKVFILKVFRGFPKFAGFGAFSKDKLLPLPRYLACFDESAIVDGKALRLKAACGYAAKAKTPARLPALLTRSTVLPRTTYTLAVGFRQANKRRTLRIRFRQKGDSSSGKQTAHRGSPTFELLSSIKHCCALLLAHCIQGSTNGHPERRNQWTSAFFLLDIGIIGLDQDVRQKSLQKEGHYDPNRCYTTSQRGCSSVPVQCS